MLLGKTTNQNIKGYGRVPLLNNFKFISTVKTLQLQHFVALAPALALTLDTTRIKINFVDSKSVLRINLSAKKVCIIFVQKAVDNVKIQKYMFGMMQPKYKFIVDG